MGDLRISVSQSGTAKKYISHLCYVLKLSGIYVFEKVLMFFLSSFISIICRLLKVSTSVVSCQENGEPLFAIPAPWHFSTFSAWSDQGTTF